MRLGQQMREYGPEERATREGSRAPIPPISFPQKSVMMGGRATIVTPHVQSMLDNMAEQKKMKKRVPVIGQSEKLKEAVAETGVQAPNHLAVVEELTRKKASPAQKLNLEEGTSSRVVHPKLDRPTPTTPTRREEYRRDQLDKAAEMGLAKKIGEHNGVPIYSHKEVNLLPMSHEDYPMSQKEEATRVTSPQMIKKQGAAFNPGEVKADFEQTRTKLYSAYTEAREKHEGEGGGTPETKAAVKKAHTTYKSHLRKNQARHTQRGTAPVVSSETDESEMNDVPVSYLGKPITGGKPIESLASNVSDRTRNWLEGQGRTENTAATPAAKATTRPKSEPNVPAN